MLLDVCILICAQVSQPLPVSSLLALELDFNGLSCIAAIIDYSGRKRLKILSMAGCCYYIYYYTYKYYYFYY
jgi:hypothetical protein